MSGHLLALLGLNGLFVATGLGLLYGVRGWRSGLALVEELGLALVLGLATVCVLATVALVLGFGLSLPTVLVLALVPAAAGVGLGVKRRRPLPRSFGWPALSPGTISALALGALTVALLVAFARQVHDWSYLTEDAFAFWIPKAKAIYFFGGLDEHLFRTLPGPSYPLLLPALDAIDFRFMGSPDILELAVQSWLLLVGFVFAAAAILRPLVRPWLVWLFAALAVALPNLDVRLLYGEADWTVDMFFVLGALFVVRWLRTREPWLLLGVGVMLAATFATKREGALFVAALLVATVVATARRPRLWLPLLAVAALAYVPNLAWRLWWSSRHVQPDLAGNSITHLASYGSRVWPSTEVVFRLLFTYHFWLALVPLALAAALLGLTSREARATAVVYLGTWVLGVLGMIWILVSDPGLTLDTHNASTPIPRAVGSIVLLSTLVAPLLIEPLLARPAQSRT